MKYKMSYTKKIIESLPQISKYGSADILLQSSIRPRIKITTPSAVKILKQVAFKNKIASLSANQIGLQQRLFVVLRQQYLKPGKWKQYDQQFIKNQVNNPEKVYQAVIGALEQNSSYDTYYAFQECPSFDGLKFKVKMPIFSNIKYVTQQAMIDFLKQKTNSKQNHFDIPQNLYTCEKLTGFKCRVWDHEIRHLQGLLPIQEKICNGQFYLLDEYKEQMQNIQYYEKTKQIQSMFRQQNLAKLKKQHQENVKNKSNKSKRNQQNQSIDLKKMKNLLQIPEVYNKNFNIKPNQIKKSYKQMYGSSPTAYTHLKKQKNVNKKK